MNGARWDLVQIHALKCMKIIVYDMSYEHNGYKLKSNLYTSETHMKLSIFGYASCICSFRGYSNSACVPNFTHTTRSRRHIGCVLVVFRCFWKSFGKAINSASSLFTTVSKKVPWTFLSQYCEWTCFDFHDAVTESVTSDLLMSIVQVQAYTDTGFLQIMARSITAIDAVVFPVTVGIKNNTECVVNEAVLTLM